jgi:hypothetical protein
MSGITQRSRRRRDEHLGGRGVVFFELRNVARPM